MKMKLDEELQELLDTLDKQTSFLCIDNGYLTDQDRYIVHSAMLIGAIHGIEWQTKASLKEIEEVYSPSSRKLKKAIEKYWRNKNGKR